MNRVNRGGIFFSGERNSNLHRLSNAIHETLAHNLGLFAPQIIRLHVLAKVGKRLV